MPWAATSLVKSAASVTNIRDLKQFNDTATGSDSEHWISNRDGPVPDSELLTLLEKVHLAGEGSIVLPFFQKKMVNLVAAPDSMFNVQLWWSGWGALMQRWSGVIS